MCAERNGGQRSAKIVFERFPLLESKNYREELLLFLNGLLTRRREVIKALLQIRFLLPS